MGSCGGAEKQRGAMSDATQNAVRRTIAPEELLGNIPCMAHPAMEG
jgi:hypothetical protein